MTTARKIFSTGETVYDLTFKNNKPESGTPGGSVLNSTVSLGRLGLNPVFLSDYGEDFLGKLIKDFLIKNGITPHSIAEKNNNKTSLALAFLNENNDAEYQFYKSVPEINDSEKFRIEFKKDDILLFGSFYAVTPNLRKGISELLNNAHSGEAIIVYDPNFRKFHLHNLNEVKPYIIENIELADIIKGSDEDFLHIFGCKNQDSAFETISKINSCAAIFYTKGKNGCSYYYDNKTFDFECEKISPISTIGAGDNFNAGIVYSIIKYNITKYNKPSDFEIIKSFARTATLFAQEVCMSNTNYISQQTADKYKLI